MYKDPTFKGHICEHISSGTAPGPFAPRLRFLLTSGSKLTVPHLLNIWTFYIDQILKGGFIKKMFFVFLDFISSFFYWECILLETLITYVEISIDFIGPPIYCTRV